MRKPRANERQQRRAEAIQGDLWCSFGQHQTFKHPDLKEQYPSGTVCLSCQIKIMSELEKVVYMPELSEAMARQARATWEARRLQHQYENYLRKKKPDMEGLVYYIRINGQIKIGFTTDLTQRSRSYPPGSELLAVEPGTKELERERHVQFHRFLARGREWFVDAPEILEHAASLVPLYGLPKKLMYRYTLHEAGRKAKKSA